MCCTQSHHSSNTWICCSGLESRRFLTSRVAAKMCCSMDLWKLLVFTIQFFVHFPKWLLLPTLPSFSPIKKKFSLSQLLPANISQICAHCTFNPIPPTRSHRLSIVPLQSTINSWRYSFFVNMTFLWNNIPIHILENSNRNSFRHNLYDHFMITHV